MSNQASAPSAAPDLAQAYPKTLADLNRPHVFLPSVAYAHQVFLRWHYGQVQILSDVPCEFYQRGNMQDGVARSRNELTRYWLDHTDAEAAVFIDSDIICNPADVARALTHVLCGGHDIVAGYYAAKGARLMWITYNDGAVPDVIDPKTGLREVTEAGLGFLVVHRRVPEAMRDRLPQIKYVNRADPSKVDWNWFPMGVVKGACANGDSAYISEDYYFCRIARQLGFKVMADTFIQLRHTGYIDYPLCKTLSDADIADLLRHRYGINLDDILRFERPAAMEVLK
jgi:hypothetical protein